MGFLHVFHYCKIKISVSCTNYWFIGCFTLLLCKAEVIAVSQHVIFTTCHTLKFYKTVPEISETYKLKVTH